jgi:hypothetical protein
MSLNYPSQEQNREAQTALQQAYDDNAISPIDRMPPILQWEPPKPKQTAIDLLSIEPCEPVRKDRITDQLDEPARDTRAQYYQDVSWFLFPERPLLNVAHEVARFVTAGSETGFVKLIWTYAEIDDGQQTTIALDPRDPFAVQNALGIGVDVLWFLRLVQHPGNIQQTIPPPYIGPIQGAPGYGYGPLPQWRDYRFQWGRDSANVFFLVPQSHALKLFFAVTNGEPENLIRVGGRLQGYTQPVDVRPTGWNVAHGW